jgi:N-sulfoglucosamine sulfohydrolase
MIDFITLTTRACGGFLQKNTGLSDVMRFRHFSIARSGMVVYGYVMKTTLLLLFACGSLGHAAKRPNILILFADDLGRYASAYADPQQPSPNDIIRTPVFDRLAREGALFHHAFVSVPSCTPSRAALMTGRHFFRNGSHSQLHHPWQPGAPDPFADVVGMPVTLRDGGYHIGHSLKLHMRESIIGGKENLYNSAGQKINEYSEILTKAEDKEAAKQQLFSEVGANFRKFLAKRQKDQPFYYAFNPTNTHRKWVRGSGKALWGLNPDDLKGKMPPVLPDVPEIREDMADYLGEAMAFDAACGVLVQLLEEMGELDHTIVMISGDHGIPGFPRGKTNVHDFGSEVLLAMRWPEKIAAKRVVRAPVSLIDIAPTFLDAAGLRSPDQPNGQSLLPALAPGADDSRLRGWVLIGRERHADRAREDQLAYPVRAIRTKEFLYVKNFKPDRWPMGSPYQVTDDSAPPFDELANNTYAAFPDMDMSPTKAWLVERRKDPAMKSFLSFAWEKRPEEELYDLQHDPHQTKNLAQDPKHYTTLGRMRDQLTKELFANDDPRLQDDAFDRPPYHFKNKNKR